MAKTKNNKKKTKASDTNQPNIVIIPIDKIKPCRWGTGIRDKEKFERLKESIDAHGLDDKPHVFPLKNGMFEIFIGDHRTMACKELGWKEIPCIVENISEQEAEERCANNNFTHADYDSVRAENRVFEMWKSGRYKAKAQLGRKIGVSDTWIGLLIKAKELREKSKLSLDASISTRCILDADLLSDEDEKIQLLTLVKKGKIKPSDVKEYVDKLLNVSEETRKRVLSGEISLSNILDGKTSILKSKKTSSSKTLVQNPNFFPELYEVLKTVEDNFAFIKDDIEKKKAISYIKFYTGIFLSILCNQKKIHKDYFEEAITHELKIDKEMLYHFMGLSEQGVDWWFKKVKKTESDE